MGSVSVSDPFFLDTGLLALQSAEVINACPAHNTALVNIDLVNERGGAWENTFHANVP
jgi:hypothetical protein